MEHDVFQISFEDVSFTPVYGSAISEKFHPNSMQTHAVRAMRFGDPATSMHRQKSILMQDVTGERYVRLAPKLRTPSMRIIMDLSNSGDITFAGVSKKSVIIEMATLLGRCAVHSGAELKGLAIAGKALSCTPSVFTQSSWLVESEILRTHTLQKGSYTNLNEAAEYVVGDLREVRSLIVVISDFISPLSEWKESFNDLAYAHSLVLIRVRAPLDDGLPPGLYRVRGAESNWSGFKTGSLAFGSRPEDRHIEQMASQKTIDFLSVNLKTDRGVHLPKLAGFFDERNQRVGGK